MRNRYLVAYDVTDPKRLRATHRKLRGFGDPVQYSVLLCDLAPKERVLLDDAIAKVINFRDDRVLIVDLGPVSGRGQECITTVGAALQPAQSAAVVV